MKLIMDTKTREVNVFLEPEDADIDHIRLETEMANLLSLAIAGQAMEHFKGLQARLMFAEIIANGAKNMIMHGTERHYDEEGNLTGFNLTLFPDIKEEE